MVLCLCMSLENRLFKHPAFREREGERERERERESDWWCQALAHQREMDGGRNGRRGEMEIN